MSRNMKISFFVLIVLSIISLSFGQPPVPIRDTDGNVILIGINYYILPALSGSGGGVTLAQRRNKTCPLDVVQENDELRNGLPLNFVPAKTNNNIIRQARDLNIRFSGVGQCIPTPVWQVEFYEGGLIVSSHGIVGKPGRKTISSWFKIVKFEDQYKMMYCPSVCKTCKPYCSDIGSTMAKNGRRSLVLNNVPLKVMFKKA